MKNFTEINGHMIAIPEDMEAHIVSPGPGEYDYIIYKCREICTADTDEEGEYFGPFFLADKAGRIFEVANLDAARAIIDAG